MDYEFLDRIARKVGTPFWLYDEAVLKQQIAAVNDLTAAPGLQARYAMKANSSTRILREIREAGIWIDAVSANESLRALGAGFAEGNDPPVILYTSDVFRGEALPVIQKHNLLPNLGSPGMIRQLVESGYRGPIALRVNPGFGHGHVNECDTGGPSSKHGIWHEDIQPSLKQAADAGFPIHVLHAHVGTGPQFEELIQNLTLLTDLFCTMLPHFPDARAVSLGGGIPHNYNPSDPPINLSPLKDLLERSHARLCEAAGRDLRLEIEPGRFFVAGAGSLITRVHDVKETRDNPKGQGVTFAMVDAGFVDLVRPVMYGSYHDIQVYTGRDAAGVIQADRLAVAGPMCESGDVFTQQSGEMIAPRQMPLPEAGDIMAIRDGGAYGYSMSSNYNSLGRPPQIMLNQDGSLEVFTRRETLEDLLRPETSEALDLGA